MLGCLHPNDRWGGMSFPFMKLTDKLQMHMVLHYYNYMGNLSNKLCPALLDNEIGFQLERPETGSIIRLEGKSKAAFALQVVNQKFDKTQLHLLQPETVSPKMGVLYKVGVLFYEGELNNRVMQGRGRLTLLKQHMEYEGMFNNNEIGGNGTLTHQFNKIVMKGIWEKGCPKDISFVMHDKPYRIVFNDLLSGAVSNNLYKGTVYYPDKRRYEGFFQYDDDNSFFSISGKGKLYYANGDILSGTFLDGNLNGQGEFSSRRAGRFVGNFVNGKFQGKGEFYFLDKKILKVGWVHNKPHGKGTLKINNLQVPVKYQNGKRIMNLVTQKDE